MEENHSDNVTAFDTLFTTNRIQMFKVILPYLPSAFQKTLAMYIKLSELLYTVSLFQQYPQMQFVKTLGNHSGNTPGNFFTDADSFAPICDELLPYLSSQERERMQQMKNMMQNFKNMQDMMEMMQMMKEMFPETENGEEGKDDAFGDISNLLNMAGIFGSSGTSDISGTSHTSDPSNTSDAPNAAAKPNLDTLSQMMQLIQIMQNPN